MIGGLPSTSIDELHNLPRVSGIYFALDATGRVLYIGRSKNIWARWQAHHRHPQLVAVEEARLAWLELPDAELLPDLENTLIAAINPAWNNTPIPDGMKKPYFDASTYTAAESEYDRHEEVHYHNWGVSSDGMSYEERRDKAIEATHPGFACRCDKCGSFRVYVDSDAGRSAESGAWGGVFMQCAECDQRADLWDNF